MEVLWTKFFLLDQRGLQEVRQDIFRVMPVEVRTHYRWYAAAGRADFWALGSRVPEGSTPT